MLSPGNLGLRFLGAIQFLTTIPISRSTVPPHEAAPFFPLIGAGIGALSALPHAVRPPPPPPTPPPPPPPHQKQHPQRPQKPHPPKPGPGPPSPTPP
ncbi:MAG: hypothetical protein ACK5TN_22775, partial [Acidobacteriota bacterium]